MTKLTRFLSVFAFLILQFGASFACGIDVSIAEGNSITMCENAAIDLNASPGYVSYDWYGPSTGTGQTFTPSAGGWYYVDATDGVACVSTDSIFVVFNPAPVPVIQSSEGTAICPSVGGTNLSLTATYNSYLWSTGDNSSTINVTTSGNYSIVVEDANGCFGTSDLQVDFLDFSITATENQAVCYDVYVGLQATGGGTYLWSTGETSDMIVVSPFETTTFSVTITNGTCQATANHTVTVHELPEYEWADTLYYGVNDYMAIEGPSNYSNFQWSPSDVVSDTVGQNIAYSGAESGTVNVTMQSENGCTTFDEVYIQIVDLAIPEGFSPNGDFTNDFFVIPELSTMKGKITIWNRWGEMVFTADEYKNDWDGNCKTALCVGNEDLPEGTYFYAIDVQGVKFDGYLTLKR